jgi:hypothetical protein
MLGQCGSILMFFGTLQLLFYFWIIFRNTSRTVCNLPYSDWALSNTPQNFQNRLAGIVLFAFAASLAYAQATGGVQGSVKDDSGQPLGAVNVFLTASDPNVDAVTTTTDDAGVFSFSSLKPGAYTICLKDGAHKHLDPCAWSTGTKVVVKPNQTATDNLVTGAAAATLQVRVDDPLKISDLRNGAGVPLVAVISDKGGLIPMSLVSVEDDGRTYQIAVPPGNHKLFIRSDTYKIANGRGEDLDRPQTADGKTPVLPVDAPVSVKSGISYVTVTITAKR